MTRRRRITETWWFPWAMRALVVVVVFAAWEYLPKIEWLQERSSIFNPFFVSSPTLVIERLSDMLAGGPDQPDLAGALVYTLQGTALGVFIGTALGALFGLLFSNSPLLAKIFSPFVTILNSAPRIALIPIFVILAGATLTTSVLTAVFVVFFLVFYNAFNGGLSVEPQVAQNARLLGATPVEIMRGIRLPYVLVWTVASLPNAISFGLISVVTAELLTGASGMGALLQTSIGTVDATLTFAVVVVLTIVGVLLVTLADVVSARALHWWNGAKA